MWSTHPIGPVNTRALSNSTVVCFTSNTCGLYSKTQQLPGCFTWPHPRPRGRLSSGVFAQLGHVLCIRMDDNYCPWRSRLPSRDIYATCPSTWICVRVLSWQMFVVASFCSALMKCCFNTSVTVASVTVHFPSNFCVCPDSSLDAYGSNTMNNQWRPINTSFHDGHALLYTTWLKPCVYDPLAYHWTNNNCQLAPHNSTLSTIPRHCCTTS